MFSHRELAEFARQHGAKNYLKAQARLLGLNEDGSVPRDRLGRAKLPESVTLGDRTVPRMHAEDFSLRALFEGLVGPVEEHLSFAKDGLGFQEMGNVSEAVATGAFPSAVGQLVSTMVIDGYEDDSGFIGDQLVQRMPSRLRNERIVGFTSLQGPKEVIEGQAYEESTFSEKYVASRETKRGRLLSITEEAIFFDQTNSVLDRARQIGYYARQERERRIIRAVIDADSGEAVYQPQGVAEALYSAGNNNLLTTATPLVDWTDIQEVLTFHALNVADDRETDDNMGGQPIVWMPRILLTATENAGVAARIVSATQFGGGATDMVTGNPLETLTPGLRSLSSPFIDQATDGDQWDDPSDWLIGDFQRQFKYKEIWPLQTLRAPAQNQEQFERDIVVRFKIREYGDVLATDEKYVVRVNAA